jgi:hypothetical protein
MKILISGIWFCVIITFLLSCCDIQNDPEPDPPLIVPSDNKTMLTIENVSDYPLTNVHFGDLHFGDINRGVSVPKDATQGKGYIIFSLQTNNGKIECRTDDEIICENEAANSFTFHNGTVIITTRSERSGSLTSLLQTLNAEAANPEIEISYNNSPVQSNDTIDLGNVEKEDDITIKLIITNKNEHDLQLIGNPEKSGNNAEQVTVTAYSVQKLEYDTSAECTVRFKPSQGGDNSFTITIKSNDQDELELVIHFTATVRNTWQRLYGEAGKRYGLFRAISNGAGGVYAGGYTGDSTAALFNFNDAGILKNTFTVSAVSGTLGPSGLGFSYPNYYAVLPTDKGYAILTTDTVSTKPSAVFEGLSGVYPQGIVKGSDGYWYVGGNVDFVNTDTQQHQIGIILAQHYTSGELNTYRILLPSDPDVIPESYTITGMVRMLNNDILLYGYAALKAETPVAFACAINTSSTFTIRWQKIYRASDGGQSEFYHHFWDENVLMLFGNYDLGGFAVKISGNTTDGTLVSEWPKTLSGNRASFRGGLKTTDGYVFVGYADGAKGGLDVWVVKTDANLTKIWENTYGGNGDDYADSILEVPDGFIIAGSTQSSNIPNQIRNGTEDIYLFKINKDGTLD